MNKVKVVVADNFNITNILINNNNEDEILLSKIIRNLLILFKYETAIDDLIIPSQNNTNIDLLIDTLIFVLTNTYNIKNINIETSFKRENIIQFATSMNELVLNYSKNALMNAKKEINSDVLTLNNVSNYFKQIEMKRSDENFFLKVLIEFINSTTKYDDFEVKQYGKISNTKKALEILKESLFPKTPYPSYVKIMSMIIHGMLSQDGIDYKNKKKLSDISIVDLVPLYSNGINLYLSKIVIIIMNSYDLTIQRNDLDTQKNLLEIINNDSYTLSAKYRYISYLLYSTYELKNTYKDYMESEFFIPVYIDELINDKGLYNITELQAKYSDLDGVYGKDIEEVLIEKLLDSDPNDSIDKIIQFNNEIVFKINSYKEKYPEIMDNLFDELNSSFVSTLFVQLLCFPESLGKYLARAGLQVINPQMNIEQESIVESDSSVNNCEIIINNLKTSTKNFVLDTSNIVIRYGFCKIKDSLKLQDNNYINAVENSLLSKLDTIQ